MPSYLHREILSRQL